jgi:3-phosphoshikimate 1-carboxyvinyltransferase
LQAREFSIPGDISSAAYFIAAACLLPGSTLEIDQVGLNPTRALFVNQMQDRGFDIETLHAREEANEPLGTVRVRGLATESLRNESSWLIDGSAVPQLIDELPLLAVVGSQVHGGIEIRDAKELRVKESDRISATVTSLRAMGAEIEEFDDGLRVSGPVRLHGARIDPFGDHRIAMAFAVAGLLAEGETEIVNIECVAVSFPEFFERLESVVR